MCYFFFLSMLHASMIYLLHRWVVLSDDICGTTEIILLSRVRIVMHWSINQMKTLEHLLWKLIYLFITLLQYCHLQLKTWFLFTSCRKFHFQYYISVKWRVYIASIHVINVFIDSLSSRSVVECFDDVMFIYWSGVKVDVSLQGEDKEKMVTKTFLTLQTVA